MVYFYFVIVFDMIEFFVVVVIIILVVISLGVDFVMVMCNSLLYGWCVGVLCVLGIVLGV